MVRCRSCGFATDDAGVRLYCPQCGARIADGVADLETYRTGVERFDRVLVAPEYGAAHRHAPGLSAAREVGVPIARLGFGAVVAAAFAALAIETGDPKVMLFVAAVALVWLVKAVHAVLVGLRRVGAATERLVVIVASDRYTGAGGRRDPVGSCEHLVTLRDRDGDTRNVYAPADLMGEVAIGDIGLAYVRHDRLLDYRWFDIMAPPLEPGEMPRSAGCRTCGAHQRFGPVSQLCAYCSAPLPRPDLGEFGARFRAAAASPAAGEACRVRVRGGVPSLLPALGLLAAGSFFAWVAYQVRALLVAAIEFSPWFLLLLAAFAAPLVAGTVWLWRLSAPYRAGRSNELVVVVRKRSQVVRSKSDNPKWRHFVTVAAPSGARRELRVLAKVAGRLQRGQLGVAHLRGEWLADFSEIQATGAPG